MARQAGGNSDTRRTASHARADSRTSRLSGLASFLKNNEPAVHLGLTILWTIAIVPTLVWWKNSVLWVALMSLWANIASHWAAFAAARAARLSEEAAAMGTPGSGVAVQDDLQ